MIFKQWEQVVGLREPPKTQTRRSMKEGDYTWVSLGSCGAVIITEVCTETHRLKWQVGRTYAVQPGRGKKAVGRIRITKIRRERLGDISEVDCLAEGVRRRTFMTKDGEIDSIYWCCPICPRSHVSVYGSPQEAYACLWNHCYGSGAWGRMENDDVWVLEWPPVEAPSG